jgi:formylglycine-generating enzyme required for sulfatase activity
MSSINTIDAKEDLLKLFKFVSIQPGKFIMGSPKDEEGRYSDEDQKEVEITKSFEMLETPVTQLQYYSIMDINPSCYEGLQKPVHNVSWNDAIEFCKKLNGLDPDHYYRLPTEAEWEYCCRAGTTTSYSFGNDIKNLDQFAHFNSNYGPINVKFLLPNPWGLYDMHGNIWEWVLDYYSASRE